MKCAIIISDGVKQIMFTPETESEKQALSMITVNDEIMLDVKQGTLYDSAPPSAMGYTVSKCQGGYLRAYECKESLMLVLRPKTIDDTKTPD